MKEESKIENTYTKRPVWQKILLYIIIGGFAYTLIYYSFVTNVTNVTKTTNQAVETPVENTIIYTNEGFRPKTLTIKIGATVSFINNSSKSMWVASDPHPVHTDYSSFDALRGYKNGESYKFSFTEKREYKYHNHFDIGDAGTVVVE